MACYTSFLCHVTFNILNWLNAWIFFSKLKNRHDRCILHVLKSTLLRFICLQSIYGPVLGCFYYKFRCLFEKQVPSHHLSHFYFIYYQTNPWIIPYKLLGVTLMDAIHVLPRFLKANYSCST